ncbi:MAG: hypothetical protein WDO06_00580 [Actinomycetota bacterium]
MNGTDAIELALRAVNIKAGMKVATVANAGNYTTSAINSIGATRSLWKWIFLVEMSQLMK